MGQYYYPTIKKEYTLEQFCAHDYGNGLKLMEHCYFNNLFVQAVLTSLIKEQGRLCWLGDYAEEDDFRNVESDIVTKTMLFSYNLFSKKEDDPDDEHLHYTCTRPNKKVDSMFVVNHSKREYIDLKKYQEIAPKNRNCIIHPIPLLTAAGNGRGLGDYRGSNESMIGYWCCDELMVMENADHLKDYKDITEEVIFIE